MNLKKLLVLVLAGTAVIANLRMHGVMTEIAPIDHAVGRLLVAIGFLGG